MNNKVTFDVNVCVEIENKRVQLPSKIPARPPQLRLKTEHYYDVKLPTYEESQKKYVKFMKVLPDRSEKQ